MSRYQSLISVADLAANLSDAKFRVIDCRFSLMQPDQGQKDYAVGHIPGASYASLDTDLAAPVSEDSGRHPLPAVDSFIETLERWGISNDSQVAVYDDAGGGVAARLWWLLRWLGHRNVALLDGGFAAWIGADQSVTQDRSQPDPGSFTGVAADESVWTVTDIESWVGAGKDFILVDARDDARFRGEKEPIDPVAGHIPGAANLPFNRALNSDGTWLSADQIKGNWANIAAGAQEGAWGVMCGSGVTACHLALSASIAGLPDPCLYVGSWSEWVRDPARPLASGP